MAKDLFVTQEAGVKELRKAVNAWMAEEPEDWNRMPMAKFQAASGWDYSRTWQVSRRWVLEARFPALLVNCSELTKDAEADQVDRILAKVVINLRDKQQESWGEINVRMGLSEGRVRSLYKKYSGKKDIGQRTGQGGRFVYGDPTLYLEHMKKEGAVIKGDFRGRPKAEQCLNYQPKAKRVRRASKPKDEVVEAPVAEPQVEAQAV